MSLEQNKIDITLLANYIKYVIVNHLNQMSFGPKLIGLNILCNRRFNSIRKVNSRRRRCVERGSVL